MAFDGGRYNASALLRATVRYRHVSRHFSYCEGRTR